MRKIFSIELLRVICTITVCVDHIAITAIHIHESTSSNVDRFVYYGIQHWSHFAVPIFLMISGFLLLNPQKKIGYEKVIKKYIKRLVIVLLTIGTFYAFLEALFETHEISFQNIGNAFLCVFEDKGWDHMWYLYMIIGIYLVLPIFKSAYNGISSKIFSNFLVVMFLFTSIMPIISSYTGFNCGIKFPIMSIFLFYFLLGKWAFDTGNKLRFNSITLYALTMIMMLIPIVLAYLEFFKDLPSLELLINYDSPLMVAISVLTVWSVMKVKEGKSKHLTYIVAHLGKNSFGIYVFHMFWINLIYKFFHYNPIEHNALYFMLLVILVLVLSDITTILFKKIPYIGSSI